MPDKELGTSEWQAVGQINKWSYKRYTTKWIRGTHARTIFENFFLIS